MKFCCYPTEKSVKPCWRFYAKLTYWLNPLEQLPWRLYCLDNIPKPEEKVAVIISGANISIDYLTALLNEQKAGVSS